MKQIYILLTRFPDRGSKVLEFFTRFHYCHAAIGLGEDLNHFYSFKRKGFMVEEITRYLKPERKPFACQLYLLEVEDHIYARVKAMINAFTDRKEQLRYSNLGLVLSVLGIPYRRRYHYFCSQFVAEVLKTTRAATLNKSTALYLPGDLRKLTGLRLIFHGNLLGMAKKFRLTAGGV